MTGEEAPTGDLGDVDYDSALKHAVELLDADGGHRSANIEQALAAFERLLGSLLPKATCGRRPLVLGYIATAYLRRTEEDPVANANAAIKALRCALREVPKDDQEALKPWLIGKLGAAYLAAGGSSADIERALRCLRAALCHLPATAAPGQRGEIKANLGFAYTQRVVGERADNIEHAISYLDSALQAFDQPEDRMLWADAQADLGAAYLEHTRGGYAANVEKAIAALGASQAATPSEKDPFRWASTTALLGKAFVRRVEGEKVSNLLEAVRYYREAVDVLRTEAGRTTWAASRFDLASAEDDLAAETNDQAALKDVEAGYREAQEVFDETRFPVQWAEIENAVGILYGRSPDMRTQAEQAFRKALAKLDGTGALRERQRTLRNLGDLFFEAQRWEDATRTYDKAIAVGDKIGATAYTDAGRREEAAIASRIYPNSAYALLRLQRRAEALARLEQGKARLLAQALALDDVDQRSLPERVPPEVAYAFVAARDRVRELDRETALPMSAPTRRTDVDLGERLQEARRALSAATEALEANGVQLRPRGLSVAEIVALASERSLIFPLVSSAGGACFLVPAGASSAGDIQELHLEALTSKNVADLVRGWTKAYRRARDSPDEPDAQAAWQNEIVSALPQLWELLMGPIDTKLRQHGIAPGTEVVLVPQGGLGLLPLQAARGNGGYFLDRWTVTLAPSAYSFAESLRRSREAARQPPVLLAVIDPMNNLPFARLEGERLRSRFKVVHSLCGARASREAVLADARQATYLHFACHAQYAFANVLDSALQLAHNDLLELREIAASEALPETRLAALSACETGMTESEDAPDEYVGLASAFLQAGAAGVLATLWAVDDLSTALLVDRFYAGHVTGGMTPSAALRDAQRWLRQATAEELKLADLLGRLNGRSEVHDRIHTYEANPSLAAFEPAHYWAAFTLTGS